MAVIVAAVATATGDTHALGSRLDALFAGLLAAGVVVAAVVCPWWVLTVAALVVGAWAPAPLAVAAFAAAVVSLARGLWRTDVPELGAPTASLLIVIAGRLESGAFFGASALVGIGACALIALGATMRAPRYARRWLIIAAALTSGCIAAMAALWLAQARAGEPAVRAAVANIRSAADHLEAGEPARAADELQLAADRIESVRSSLDAPQTQWLSLVPVMSQHQRLAVELLTELREALREGAQITRTMRLEFTAVDDAVDVGALNELTAPLERATRIATQFGAQLSNLESRWLHPEIDNRLRSAVAQLARARETLADLRDVAANANLILGETTPTRWLVGFTTPAEARGTSGFAGNWAELSISQGRVTITGRYRSADLVDRMPKGGLRLDLPEDFLRRYGRYGMTTVNGGAHPLLWSVVTMSPDLPNVGRAVQQMYLAATDRHIDGVMFVRPRGIARLLDVTGPITLPELSAEPITSSTLEQLMLTDQYRTDQDERIAALDRLLVSTFSAIVDRGFSIADHGRALADAARGGDLVAWSSRPDLQRVLARFDFDGALPDLGGRDGLIIVNNNAGGNKIDAFLERSVSYAVTHTDAGKAEANLDVLLANTAPTSGLPAYVLANSVGLAPGTNRSLISIYSPLELASATVDGSPTMASVESEHGWNVYSLVVDIPAGTSKRLTVQLYGQLACGEYKMAYSPREVVIPTAFTLSAHEQPTPSGNATTVCE